MKKLNLTLVISFVIIFSFVFISTNIISASTEKECEDKAVELLKKYDKIGYQVYLTIKEKDPDFFSFFLSCSSSPYNVTTAVHESVHNISGIPDDDFYSYQFYLPNGSYQTVKRHDLFYRSEIAKYLKSSEKDNYYKTYLTGRSGQQGVLLLLDEVNAYTFSAIGDTNVRHTMSENQFMSTRDGLATFMYYLQLYLYHARTEVPQDYKKIKQDKKYVKLIKTLWENAEMAMLYTSPYKNLGINDIPKLEQVVSKKYMDEIKTFFEGTGVEINFRENLLERVKYSKKTKKTEFPDYLTENYKQDEDDDEDEDEVIIEQEENYEYKDFPDELYTDNIRLTINGVTYTTKEIIDIILKLEKDLEEKNRLEKGEVIYVKNKKYSYKQLVSLAETLLWFSNKGRDKYKILAERLSRVLQL